jgi:hypothetical protein
MAAPKRLVLFVEGQGEREAVPVLVKRLLTEIGGWSHLALPDDPRPFVVGNVADLTKNNGKDWIDYLNAARKRTNLGAVLLVQDGDITPIRGEEFCPAWFGARLGEWARAAGAGTLFSVATVFACQEYESWMLACAEQLAGQPLPDGRPGIRSGTTAPAGDLEQNPRDAKKWFRGCMDGGYKPIPDQRLLTQLMVNHLDAVRQRGLRSFRRLENALQQLVNAVRTGIHVVTPESPPPAE